MADDKPREATQNVNPDGSRKPTENEMRSAVAAFKTTMLADGASEEDINRVLKETSGWTPPPLYEVKVGNDGTATRYTTPSAHAVAGAPAGEEPKDTGEYAGGTSVDAVIETAKPARTSSRKSSSRKTSSRKKSSARS